MINKLIVQANTYLSQATSPRPFELVNLNLVFYSFKTVIKSVSMDMKMIDFPNLSISL